jgi:hypothetical protein
MRTQSLQGIINRLARNGWIALALASGCCWHHCGGGRFGAARHAGTDTPLGTAVNAWYEEQANRAEANDFTIYLNEWYMGGLDLGPMGLHHLADIARRAPEVPFPVVIEPHLDAALNEQRRQHIVNALQQQGIGDADARVIVAYPQAEGLYAEEGTRLFYQMFMNRNAASRGGWNGWGGAGWGNGWDGGWGGGAGGWGGGGWGNNGWGGGSWGGWGGGLGGYGWGRGGFGVGGFGTGLFQ